jgi:hypothetical protein
MSKYGVDYTSNKGKGIVIADGFQTTSGVTVPKVVLSGTITVDPPSLTTGAFAEGDATITGVALGDKIDLFPPYDTQGVIYQATPAAANTVTISWTSCSTSTINLAEGTWGYTVTRRA